MIRNLGIFLLVLSFLIPTTAFALSGDGDIPEARPQMCTSSGVLIDVVSGEERDVSGDVATDLSLLFDLVIRALAALP
ncbi:MAG: hypothetical protein JW958_06375 [Candidatus Eisenbacteria bacterium]|nr:hypothetical protein [Candidatus Eisenbacteria bacterium]